jgi:transposase
VACFGLVPRGLYGLVAGTAQSWFSHRRPGNDYSRDRSRSEQVGQLYSFGGNRPERAWSQTFRKTLVEHAKPLSECGPDELWRGLLRLELEHLEQVETLLGEVETRLDQLGRADQRVRLVQTIPDVGPRTAEAIVTAIDDPQRFANARQVGAYTGLTPRRFQSGQLDRNGRISKRGNRVLRRLLNQVAWLSLRYNPWARQSYERIRGGRADRKKIAITAVSRRLLVIAWAMLRDGRPSRRVVRRSWQRWRPEKKLLSPPESTGEE